MGWSWSGSCEGGHATRLPSHETDQKWGMPLRARPIHSPVEHVSGAGVVCSVPKPTTISRGDPSFIQNSGNKNHMKSISTKALAKSIALAIGVFAAASANADVTVGVANGNNCYPFGCNFGTPTVGQSYDYKQIFSASAFSGKTSFDSIAFFDTVYPGAQLASGTYDITFSTTTAALGASYGAIPLTNTSTFFDGSLSGSAGSKFTINGSSYTYDPTAGNLVMEVVVTNQANGYFGTLDADGSGNTLSRAYQITNEGGIIGGDNIGFVTEFATTSAVPESSNAALMLLGLAAVGAALRRQSVRA